MFDKLGFQHSMSKIFRNGRFFADLGFNNQLAYLFRQKHLKHRHPRSWKRGCVGVDQEQQDLLPCPFLLREIGKLWCMASHLELKTQFETAMCHCNLEQSGPKAYLQDLHLLVYLLRVSQQPRHRKMSTTSMRHPKWYWFKQSSSYTQKFIGGGPNSLAVT